MEDMKHHIPFKPDTPSTYVEALGLGVYITLAQTIQVIGRIYSCNEQLDSDGMSHVIEAISGTLAWMEATGFSERYPELRDMPLKVDPLEFQGDTEGLMQWFDRQLRSLKAGE